MVAELHIKICVKAQEHGFCHEFVRPGDNAKWTFLPIFLGNPGPPGWFPSVALVTKCVNDGIDFLQGHTICHLSSGSARHRAIVAINASVCFQVQFPIEKLSIHALNWQTALASFTENS